VEWAPTSRWRPFCSERCKLIDLGAWASGERVIPGEPLDALPSNHPLEDNERHDKPESGGE